MGTAEVQATRIALFTGSMRGGGAERVMLTIASSLAARGMSVDLVLMHAEGEYLDLVPHNVRVIDLDCRRTLACVSRFLRYVLRERPTVVLATLPQPSLAALVVKLVVGGRLRVLVRQANMFTESLNANNNGNLRRLRLFRLLLPVADASVAVSEGVASDIRAQAPRAARKMTTIFNPVVSSDIFDKAAVPVEHPWFNDGTLVVLAAGRLSAVKDYPTLLRAFAEVVRSRPARLVILGQGVERESLLDLAEQLGVSDRFDLPGFDVNPFRYMARASVFVLSSRYEGFGNVLAQAMACGASCGQYRLPQRAKRVAWKTAGGVGWCRWATGGRWRGPSRTRLTIRFVRKRLKPGLLSTLSRLPWTVTLDLLLGERL